MLCYATIRRFLVHKNVSFFLLRNSETIKGRTLLLYCQVFSQNREIKFREILSFFANREIKLRENQGIFQPRN